MGGGNEEGTKGQRSNGERKEELSWGHREADLEGRG